MFVIYYVLLNVAWNQEGYKLILMTNFDKYQTNNNDIIENELAY